MLEARLNRLLFGLISTLTLPFALVFAFCSPKLRTSLAERLMGGSWRGVQLNRSIWIHAASVGELQGVVPLLKKLREQTNDPIVVTTTSSTGKLKASELPGVQDALLLPYDHPISIALAISKIRPSCFLLFETELWPNLLLQLRKFNIPIILVNGRISDRTFPNYLRFRFLLRPLLSGFSKCLVQSAKDRTRFEILGASNVQIEGNTKYDIDSNDLSKEVKSLSNIIGWDIFGCPPNMDLLVCGSVRPGESQIIFSAYKELRKKFPNLRLLIAPRHPEQFDIEAANALSQGFLVSRRTAPKENADVFLLDSLGELKTAYALSTISFVGGTLVPIGGHNTLEPAAYSKPVLFGPYTQNVEDVSNELVEAGGAFRVQSVDSFVSETQKLLTDREYLSRVGQASFKVLCNHQGSVSRVLKEIEPYLHSPVAPSEDRLKLVVLKALSLVYSFIISSRNFLYDHRFLTSYKSLLPVVCVGNVTVGGNAKSPVTQALARFLLEQNFKPVILLRGYSGNESGPIEVIDHREILRFGDEACMHKLELGSIPVVVSRSRVAGAKFIEEQKLGDVILLDDGFQHRALDRDINLLLFDFASVVQATRGELLPLGRLRESLVSALKRADIVGLVEREATITAPSWIPGDKPVFHFSLEFSGLSFVDSSKEISWQELGGKTVSAIASIAKPKSFKQMIQARGVVVEKTIFKSDHALWSAVDLPAINALPGEYIITTAKDIVKLGKMNELPKRLLVAKIRVNLTDSFKSWILERLTRE